MKILAIDTTSNICSAAILDNEKLIFENTINNGLTHSENLMPLVKDLFEKSSITLKEIDLIAVCIGPGSFTGIRIGISSVKAMAEVHDIPVVSVTSLEALANGTDKTETIVSLIDARNDQVYCGVFDENINLQEEYMADDINIILEKLQKFNNITFVGNGSVIHKDLIREKINNPIFSEANEQSSFNVGIVGLKKYEKNEIENADSIAPMYLRKSRAE